jgi:uncharacterized protein
MLSPAVDGAVHELKRRVVQRFGDRVLRVVVFGSMARGAAGGGSDVDVLVLVKGLTPKEMVEVVREGADIWMDTRVPLSPLAMSDAEWDHLVKRERLLPREIERDGIVV